MDFKTLTHAAQRAAISKVLDEVLKNIEKDRTATYLRLLDTAKFFYGDNLSEASYNRLGKF